MSSEADPQTQEADAPAATTDPTELLKATGLILAAGAVAVVPWVVLFTGPIGRHNWIVRVDNWHEPSFLSWIPTIALTPTAGAILTVLLITTALVFLARLDEVPSWFLVGAGLIVIAELIGVFAATYSQTAHDHHAGANACFSPVPGPNGVVHSPHVGHWDALYYTVGVLTTAGSGTLEPFSESCRRIATAQMLIDFLILSVAIALLVVRLSRAREPGPKDPVAT